MAKVVSERSGEDAVLCRPSADMGHRGGAEFTQYQALNPSHAQWSCDCKLPALPQGKPAAHPSLDLDEWLRRQGRG